MNRLFGTLLLSAMILKQASSECLSKEAFASLGWNALDTPIEPQDLAICQKFFENSKAKACVDMSKLKDIIEESSNSFASSFSETQSKLFLGLQENLKEMDTLGNTFKTEGKEISDSLKAQISSLEGNLKKFDIDAEKIKKEFEACNLATQTNSFGIYCLLASDIASDYAEATSKDGGHVFDVKITLESANQVVSQCASSLKNNCLFNATQNTVEELKNGSVSSKLAECSGSLFDCNFAEESSSNSDNCPLELSNSLINDFNFNIKDVNVDDKVKDLIKDIQSSSGQIWDDIKDKGESLNVDNLISGFNDSFINFSADNIKDQINDSINDSINNLNPFKGTSGLRLLYESGSQGEGSFEIKTTSSSSGYDTYSTGKESGWQTKKFIERFMSSAIYFGFLITLFNC
jgi:hypothetical protein